MNAQKLVGFHSLRKIGGADIVELRIPPYQRTYCWGEDQIEALWDSITKSCSLSEGMYYFVGSVLFQKGPDTPITVDVVDGQQRVLTLTMLSTILVCKARELGGLIREDDKDHNLFLLHDSLSKSKLYVQNTDKDAFNEATDYQQCLSTIQAWEDEVGNWDSPDERAKLAPIRVGAVCLLKHIKAGLEETDNTDPWHYLQKIAGVLLRTFEFIQVTVEDTEDAFEIFHTMNSLGVPLAFVDILKGRLVAADESIATEWETLFETPAEGEEKNFWQNSWHGQSRYHLLSFIDDYLQAENGDFNGKQGFKENKAAYERDVLDVLKDLGPENAKKEWQKIQNYAQEYCLLEYLQNEIEPNRPYFSLLRRCLPWIGSTPIPLMLHALHDFTPPQQEDLFFNLIKLTLDKTMYASSLKSSHLYTQNQIKEGQWKVGFQRENLEFYSRTPAFNPRGKKLLMLLEDYLDMEQKLSRDTSQDAKTSSDLQFDPWPNELTLEHFRPQNKDDKNTQLIGNMTVLSRRANSRMGKKPPERKLNADKDNYAKLYVNGKDDKYPDLALHADWTDEAIQKRTDAIVKLIGDIFGPDAEPHLTPK